MGLGARDQVMGEHRCMWKGSVKGFTNQKKEGIIDMKKSYRCYVLGRSKKKRDEKAVGSR